MTNKDELLPEEITFEQKRFIDSLLENYRRNPSNSNKYRIGLHTAIEEIIDEKLTHYISKARVKEAVGELEPKPRFKGEAWAGHARQARNQVRRQIKKQLGVE